MRSRLALLTLALSFILSGCPASDTVELTIFHTNDIHSHLRPSPSDPYGLGGIARLATLLKTRREKAPLSVTLDAGDWSEGSWYYSLDTGANMLKFLSALGYDAAALGNHDFLAGPARVIRTVDIADVSMPVLAANLDPATFSDPEGLKRALPATYIKQVGNLKVGVIGLTTYEFLYDSYMAPVKITNPLETATRFAAELRPQVDVLILVSHNAFETNMELAKAVPGIDAVISGHSHRKVPQAVLVKNAGRDVPVVETNEWAKFLGELKLSVSRSTHTVAFKGYQLLPVGPSVVEDPVVAGMVDEETKRLNRKFNTDINRPTAEAEFAITRYDAGESPMSNLAVKAYRASTGAELAMDEISFNGVNPPQGRLTLLDLHDISPHLYDAATNHEWTLKVWNARGSDLWVMINLLYTGAAIVPMSPLGWLAVEGAVITWQPGPLGGSLPVKSILINGRPLDVNARYRVAIHDALVRAIGIANSSFGLKIDLSQLQETGIETWRSIVDYATRAQTLRLEDLRVGGRVKAIGPDLGIYPYTMDWDGTTLSLEVENLGLSQAEDITLSCSSGTPDDPVVAGTPLQKWTEFHRSALAPIGPESFRKVTITWNPGKSRRAGTLIPVRCDVTYAKSAYTVNNRAEKVFRR